MTSPIVGIDYSMTSPAMCVHIGDQWSFNNCRFFYLTDKKKFAVTSPFLEGYLHLHFLTQEERFDNISNFFLSKIPDGSKVYIEGYAFGAKGQVFNIGENVGLLKHKLWKKGISYDVLAPSAVKKFATEKGNADKLKMHEAFVKEVGIKLDCHFGIVAGQSPASDIIDAYYISKLGFTLLYNTLQSK